MHIPDINEVPLDGKGSGDSNESRGFGLERNIHTNEKDVQDSSETESVFEIEIRQKRLCELVEERGGERLYQRDLELARTLVLGEQTEVISWTPKKNSKLLNKQVAVRSETLPLD
jgi:hypothetical protein